METYYSRSFLKCKHIEGDLNEIKIRLCDKTYKEIPVTNEVLLWEWIIPNQLVY